MKTISYFKTSISHLISSVNSQRKRLFGPTICNLIYDGESTPKIYAYWVQKGEICAGPPAWQASSCSSCFLLLAAGKANNVKLPPWNMDTRWDFIAVNFELLNMYFQPRQNQRLNLQQKRKWKKEQERH